jgi:hypothetical protein
MNLRPADPRITMKLLEGRKDLLGPLAEARRKFYDDQHCIRCGGTAFTRITDSKTMFVPNDPLPRYLLKCRDCECLFDPHSGLLLTMGNLGKAFVPTIPILEGTDD